MAKEIIVAKFTHTDESGKKKQYVGKRETAMYSEKSPVDAQLVAFANQGLTLRVQAQIRDALKVSKGLKTVSSGGESVDLSAIESV